MTARSLISMPWNWLIEMRMGIVHVVNAEFPEIADDDPARVHAVGQQRPDRSAGLPERRCKDVTDPDRPASPHGGVRDEQHVQRRVRHRLDRDKITRRRKKPPANAGGFSCV